MQKREDERAVVQEYAAERLKYAVEIIDVREAEVAHDTIKTHSHEGAHR